MLLRFGLHFSFMPIHLCWEAAGVETVLCREADYCQLYWNKCEIRFIRRGVRMYNAPCHYGVVIRLGQESAARIFQARYVSYPSKIA